MEKLKGEVEESLENISKDSVKFQKEWEVEIRKFATLRQSTDIKGALSNGRAVVRQLRAATSEFKEAMGKIPDYGDSRKRKHEGSAKDDAEKKRRTNKSDTSSNSSNSGSSSDSDDSRINFETTDKEFEKGNKE